MRRTLSSPRTAVLFAVVALVAVLLPAPAVEAAPDYEAVVDLTFPVAGENRYIDDYHQLRGGGTRRHKATDIMASYGQPVHATVGGTISMITGLDGNPPHWGYAIYVAGDDGRTYVYIHLGRQDGPPSEAYAPGMRQGVRVERGQHIGYLGHSGNASASAPHLHVEIHDDRVTDPYGSNRLNPYPSLRAAEARGDLPLTELALSGCAGTSYAFAGDWDRSGRDGFGWWCDGQVRLRTAAGEVISYRYGRAGDVPIVADWNGDGRDTVSIVRDRTWHINDQLDGGDADRSFVYGRVTQGDVPIAGDWNGDGRDTIGIIRDGEWHLRFDQAGGPGQIVFTYGRITRGDRALIGDWNGDGSDTIGIVRDGEWHLRHSLSGGPGETVYVYGRVTSGDTPVMGDWTGDRRATPGIVRGDAWHLRHRHAAGYADQTVTFAAS
jgi:hypothetical protein